MLMRKRRKSIFKKKERERYVTTLTAKNAKIQTTMAREQHLARCVPLFFPFI